MLGVEVRITEHGLKLLPSAEKRKKWTGKISAVLEDGLLYSGEASKLSGAF